MFQAAPVYSQVAHHRAFESPSRESHRSLFKGRRPHAHACASRFFLSDLNTTADTFLGNPFPPPIYAAARRRERYRESLEKVTREASRLRSYSSSRKKRRFVLPGVRFFFFFNESAARVPSSRSSWSLALDRVERGKRHCNTEPV